MLTVDHYARIRQLRRDGLTIRQIAEQLGHSPKTILKALEHPEPPPLRQPPRLVAYNKSAASSASFDRSPFVSFTCAASDCPFIRLWQ